MKYVMLLMLMSLWLSPSVVHAGPTGITGELWMSSPDKEKMAYILGFMDSYQGILALKNQRLVSMRKGKLTYEHISKNITEGLVKVPATMKQRMSIIIFNYLQIATKVEVDSKLSTYATVGP